MGSNTHFEQNNCVRFEVITAVVIKNSTFWDIMPTSPVTTDDLEEYVNSIFRVE
jgi:hypothetical protein